MTTKPPYSAPLYGVQGLTVADGLVLLYVQETFTVIVQYISSYNNSATGASDLFVRELSTGAALYYHSNTDNSNQSQHLSCKIVLNNDGIVIPPGMGLGIQVSSGNPFDVYIGGCVFNGSNGLAWEIG